LAVAFRTAAAANGNFPARFLFISGHRMALTLMHFPDHALLIAT
jgi:hypothetical protein